MQADVGDSGLARHHEGGGEDWGVDVLYTPGGVRCYSLNASRFPQHSGMILTWTPANPIVVSVQCLTAYPSHLLSPFVPG